MRRAGVNIRIEDFCTASRVRKLGQCPCVTMQSGICPPTAGARAGTATLLYWALGFRKFQPNSPTPSCSKNSFQIKVKKKKNSCSSNNLTSWAFIVGGWQAGIERGAKAGLEDFLEMAHL